MRYVFKTRYEQDLSLTRHGGDVFWYSILLIGAAFLPLVMGSYQLGELSLLLIWVIGGLGTMIVVGYSGQISLGQAAFIGLGAYAHAVMLKIGIPFLLSLPASALLAGAMGLAIGMPLTRLHGIYLAIGTLAFASVAEQIFAHWEGVTGGLRGMAVQPPEIMGLKLDSGPSFYYLCLALAIACPLGVINWLRSPTGRALIAIRDSEIAAKSMGVNIVYYKAVAFSASAFLSGLMGALLAHKISYLAPETFGPLLSIQMLMLVVVGGLGAVHGAYFGAAFIVMLPVAISAAKQFMPQSISQQPAIEPGLFGIILVLFIIFEPTGMYGRWQKIKYFFAVFPLYKVASFRRQKTYMRTERLK